MLTWFLFLFDSQMDFHVQPKTTSSYKMHTFSTPSFKSVLFSNLLLLSSIRNFRIQNLFDLCVCVRSYVI